MKILNVSINTVVRFAVPCFMLITGTFVFENISKKVSWKEFYKKVINSIIIPTLLYSVMYVIYLELKNCIDGKKSFYQPFNLWAKGIPFGHMWYMYMLIGFYLAIPLIYLIRKKVNRYMWGFIGFICIIISGIINNDSLIAPIWFLCWLQYIGYFIIGDFFGEKYQGSKQKLYKYIGCSLIILVLMVICSINKLNYEIRFDFQPQNFLTVIFSISVYMIFRNYQFKYKHLIIERIAHQSNNIYFIHALVINLIVIIMNRLQWQYRHPIIFLIISYIVVVIVCYIWGCLFEKFFKFELRSRRR